MVEALHTNKATAIAKAKRKSGVIRNKSQAAIDSGDVQAVIDSLTDKQRRFCEEYLTDLNGTQAIIRAGYQTKYPNRIAFQMMENPAIRIAIDGLRNQRSKTTDVTKDFVLKKIQRAIAKADEDNNHNAVLRGLELLARHLGMFIERTEISGPDGKAIELEQRTKQDVEDFKSRIARLSSRGGEEPVLSVVK